MASDSLAAPGADALANTAAADAAGAAVPSAPQPALPDPELHRHEVTARELAAQAEAALREKHAANAAAARARRAQADAVSEAELLISTARAELEAARAAQADYRRAIVTSKARLTAEAKAHLGTVKSARAAFVHGGDYDRLYDQVSDALSETLARGLGEAHELWAGRPEPPSAPALRPALVALSEQRPLALSELQALQRRLTRAHQKLSSEADALARERIDRDRDQAAELASMRTQLLGRLSADKRAQVLGLRADAIVGVRLELVHIALQVGYWLRLRADQARGHISTIDDWLALGELLWSLIEILLILLGLRIAQARWDRWMTAIIGSAGRSVHLGSGALLLARIAELARSFGPALLVAVSALAVYLVLEERRIGEVEVAFIVVFWLALFRAQLRLVTSFTHAVGTRRVERQAQQRELDQALAADASGTPDPPTAGDQPEAPDPAEDPVDLEPWWQTLARTWRVATRYSATLFVLLSLVEYGAGRAVTHHALVQLAWWGTLALALYGLHVWRRRILFEYLRRTSSREGVLAQLAERHASRFYGIVVVIPALAIVIARQSAGLVKQHLSNLDSTKRLFAWLFRRRVEKHAHQHGRVLEAPHELPQTLHEHFPTRPLEPADRPTKPTCLSEIAAQFARWQENGSDGSIALVGSAGMGKSTILRALPKELGEEVMHAELITKVSRPQTLYGRLARLLELDGEPQSEAEMISLLRDEKRRVIALDGCHNLFLRQVGGFEAWEAFTHLVNETSDNVFWVVTFNDVAWDYLNNINSGFSYFGSTIRLTGWSDTELRHLVLSRMRRAKYRSSFTDLLVTRLEGVSVSSQIIGTSQGYFRLLWDFTNGNPRDACHFWLRSLVPEEGKDRRVRVHLFAAPRIDELAELPDDIVFVLQAMVEHENLTADELTRVSNLSPDICRFALRYCRDAGYLLRDPLTGRSRLSTHWHQTIIRYLKRQNLIYS